MRNTSRYVEADARYLGLLLAVVTAHVVQTEAKKKDRRRWNRTALTR
jgi:hypothetical protein